MMDAIRQGKKTKNGQLAVDGGHQLNDDKNRSLFVVIGDAILNASAIREDRRLR